MKDMGGYQRVGKACLCAAHFDAETGSDHEAYFLRHVRRRLFLY